MEKRKGKGDIGKDECSRGFHFISPIESEIEKRVGVDTFDVVTIVAASQTQFSHQTTRTNDIHEDVGAIKNNISCNILFNLQWLYFGQIDI